MIRFGSSLILVFFIAQLSAQQIHKDRAYCEKEWMSVSKAHKSKFFESNFQAKVNCLTLSNGSLSDPVEFELKKGTHNKYVGCEFMRAWVDTNHMVLVFDESKTILFQNNVSVPVTSKMNWGFEMELQQILDSTRMFIAEMLCQDKGKNNELVIRYKVDHRLNTSRVSEVRMTYAKSTKHLEELCVVYFRNNKKVEEITRFVEYTKLGKYEPFTGSSLNAVADNGKIKKAFSGYMFRDLRNVSAVDQ